MKYVLLPHLAAGRVRGCGLQYLFRLGWCRLTVLLSSSMKRVGADMSYQR